MKTAGFVLTGGRSSRMGLDKAFLTSDLRPLIQQVAIQVASAAGDVALIGAPDRYRTLGLDCFHDLRPGLGPLAGIETALETGRGDLNLIVACDMPGLDSHWLSTLLQKARAGQWQCVLTRDRNGTVHPLCAVYRSNCLPKIRRALDARGLKLQDLTQELDAATVEINEILWNVNTPEEWTAFQRRHIAQCN